MKAEKPRATDPLHYPEVASKEIRTKRAWWLLLLTLLVPGSAQILAGNKRWGRRILRVTLLVWFIFTCTVIVAFLKRELLLNILFSPSLAPIIILALILLSVGWIGVFINTLRLIKVPLLKRAQRPVLSCALLACMIVSSGTLGYGAYLMFITHNALNEIFNHGIDVKPIDGRYNFLLLGGDAGENRLGRRPDSISVISVEADTGKAVTMAVPRNTQNAPFPADSPMSQVYPEGYNCGDECIINHLYPEVNEKYQDLYPSAKDPGAQAVKEAVGSILGIKIQAYILVDMEGFVQLIDAMGGVTVEVGGWVPISGAVIEGTDQHLPPVGWIQPGVRKLDGKTALWYGRSREWTTDFSRIQRQQCIQQAMLKQLTPAVVFTRFQELAASSTEIIESDISISQLGNFVDLAEKSRRYPMRRLTIGPPDFGDATDNFNTYPDWDLVHSHVYDLLHDRGASTDKPQGSSSSATENSGTQDPDSQDGKRDADSRKNLTEGYLQQLAVRGQTETLVQLLGNNGECRPI